MKKIIAFVLTTAFATALFAAPEDVIIRTDRMQCPLQLDGREVNVRDLLENIENRISTLQTRAARDPELRRTLQPALSELSALVKLFPEEVYVIPVQAEVFSAMRNEEFQVFAEEFDKLNTDEDRISFLSERLDKAYVSTWHAAKLLGKFHAEDSKLRSIELLRGHIVDPENVGPLEQNFELPENIDRLYEVLYSR